MKNKLILIAKIIIVITSIMFWISLFFPQLTYWIRSSSVSLISNTFDALIPSKKYEKFGVSIGCSEIDGKIKSIQDNNILTNDGDLYKLGTYSDGSKCKKVEMNIDLKVKDITYSYLISIDDILYKIASFDNNTLKLEKIYDLHKEGTTIKYSSFDFSNPREMPQGYVLYDDGLFMSYYYQYVMSEYLWKSIEYTIDNFEDTACGYDSCYYLKTNGDLNSIIFKGFENKINDEKILDEIKNISKISNSIYFISSNNKVYNTGANELIKDFTFINNIKGLVLTSAEDMQYGNQVSFHNKINFLVYTDDGKMYYHKNTNKSECSKYSDVECVYEYIDVTEKYLIAKSKPILLSYNEEIYVHNNFEAREPNLILFENGEAYVIYH